MLRRFFVLVVTVLMASVATGEELVVMVVHRSNPVNSLSQQELAAIYSGQTTRWPDGQKIVAVNQPADTLARALLYRVLFGAQPGQNFTVAGSPAPFRTTLRQTDRSVTQLVSHLSNAIGYVRLSAVNERVKIVTVDGLAPDETGYLLTIANNTSPQ